MTKNYLLKIFIACVVIALDLITKNLFLNTNLEIIPFLISTRSVPINTGGAWGLLSGHLWFLIAITVVFIVFLFIFEGIFKCKHPLYTLAISFVAGGAIGNFVDRIFLGGVRDFIYFDFWADFPTFNLADSFLFIGTILLMVFAIFVYKPKEKKL